jgi:amidase
MQGMNDLHSLSAAELVALLTARTLSAEEAVSACLARIATVNPQINAVVQLAPDALDQARQADADLAEGHSHGPLHGLPFTVKDVFDVGGIVSAVGLEHRRGFVPGYDATAVARLKAAGAILIAKTNCPPGGGGGDTENTIYGRTLNPYNLSCTPGGSSGGEAALVAAGGSPLGLGSDSGGSIRLPAHYCGVAGIKPTTGRVPNTGAYDHPGGLTDPRTQVGLLARSAADLALALPHICGPDNYDGAVVPMPLGSPHTVDLRSLRVAYFLEERGADVTPETANAVGAAAQALARAGATLEERHPPQFVRDGRRITEAWWGLESLRGQDVVELFNAWDAYRTRMLQFFAEHHAVLCPADSHPAPRYRDRDPKRFDYTLPFSLLGWPVVTVRAGAAKGGLPIGVQLTAKPWRDDIALSLAIALERELGGWQAPKL